MTNSMFLNQDIPVLQRLEVNTTLCLYRTQRSIIFMFRFVIFEYLIVTLID